MSKVIEIKAMSQEEAITRALNIAEALPHQVVRVNVIQKSKSFLGIFNKQGIYEIEIDTNLKKEKEVKKEIKEEKKITQEKIEKEIKKPKVIKKEEVIKSKKEKVPEVKEVKIESKNKDNIQEEIIKKDLNQEILEKSKKLLSLIGLNLVAEVKKLNGRNYLVNLSGKDNGIIIGKKGKTLNSFEYLLNSMVKDCRIEVDVEGFREKRIETLKELAKKMSEKALKTGRTVRLNPMPPRERKIIHEIVNTYEELVTNSEGREPKRYIVIKKKR